MAIKVFCGHPVFTGYINNPADGFGISIPFEVFCSTGGENDGPRAVADTASLTMAIGATPSEVYADLYAAILASCANVGWPTPAKTDIYGFPPASFAALLPDQPAIA